MDTSNLRTHAFHVSGMHCKSCVLTIESDLMELPGISRVSVDLVANMAQVTGEFGDEAPEEIAARLSRALEKGGYVFTVGSAKSSGAAPARWDEFTYAAPIAAAVVIAFVALQKTGLVNLIGSGDVTYGTAFIIGVVASLSTCMAVVGGLVLSMSATFAKHGDKARPLVLFHAGRIVAFFLLGGVIGALGSVFRLSGTVAFLLALVIGAVMVILGVNLLDVFPWAKRFQPAMPKFISRHARGAAALDHSLVPALVGVGTFFLPCGFTQSMQIYTLTTGGFMAGGLTMLAFAAGTLPVLALISFGSLSMEKSPRRGVFFKSAGLVVIAFALFNVVTAMVAAGYLPPFFNI